MRGRPRAWRRWLIAAAAASGVAGCQRRPPAPVVEAAPHYVVGAPWRGTDGSWFYPREQFELHQTGLAVIGPTATRPLTADGERADPASLTAAHQTLQLPAVIRVTDLENGRQLLVRVDDRGPSTAGRLLALTPAAGRLLGISPGLPARVAIDVDPDRSRAAAGAVSGAPHLDIAAAPVQAVQEQPLDAPGASAGTSSGARRGPDPAVADEAASAAGPLPATVVQGIPDPRALWIDAGRFSQPGYAERVAAQAGGIVRTEGSGRATAHEVRVGPFQRVPDADAALDRARRAGVTGARIIVE